MNLSLEDAAKKLNLTSSAKSSAVEKLQRMERGDKRPTQGQLNKMANVYRQPVVAFYLDSEPRKSERGEDFRTLPQQKQDPIGNARLEVLLSMIKARQSLTRDLLEEEEVERLPFVASTDAAAGVDFIADDIDKSLGFDRTQFRRRPSQPAESFKYLRKCVEDQGIFVLLVSDLGHPQTNTIPVSVFRGFALTDEFAPYVVVNRKDSKRAQSFTLLHEVAHIWLGSSGISGKIYDSNFFIERLCSRIAGRILLSPQELSVFSSLQYEPFEHILHSIRRFANARNISRSMVAYNLRLERYISLEIWLQLQRRYDHDQRVEEQKQKEKRELDKALGKSTPIDANRLKRFSLGEPLLDLARRSLANGELTPTKASTLLGVNPRKVRSFLYPERRGRAV